MKQEENKCIYVVEKKIKETHDVSTLELRSQKGDLPVYMAGQYITIYFPESGTPEGKAYSISNAPGESSLNITVKSMGTFSEKLVSLIPGDTITGSLPYGYFYTESFDSPLVLIAAGIGIAPFRSIISDSLNKNPKRNILLFYSNRTAKDIVFKDDFNDLASVYPSFEVSYFITREKVSDENVFNSRMSEEVLHNANSRMQNAEYMICGGISFTRDMWRLLMKVGVQEEKIYTEAFFSH